MTEPYNIGKQDVSSCYLVCELRQVIDGPKARKMAVGL